MSTILSKSTSKEQQKAEKQQSQKCSRYLFIPSQLKRGYNNKTPKIAVTNVLNILNNTTLTQRSPSIRFNSRDLKIEVFRHLPRFANVKKSRNQCLACQNFGLRFTFVRLDRSSEVSDLPQGVLHPKTSQSHVWEKIPPLRALAY